MPFRRPSCFVAFSSHLSAPSGFIPGGVEVGCGELVYGGFGAGPDRYLYFLFKVFCANYKGSTLVFSSFQALKCNAIADMTG
jgi:hypothetical protein